MKILHTVHRYHPETGGSEEVVKKLSEYLVSFGHDVTVATSVSAKGNPMEIEGVRIMRFACSGDAVQGVRGEGERYVKFVLEGGFDVVLNYSAHIWTTDLLLPHLQKISGAKILVPLGFHANENPAYVKYFADLPGFLRQYDRIVYLSDSGNDAAFGKEHSLENGVVIPNGADWREFHKGAKGAFRKKYGLGNSLIMLHVSNHSLLKNHAFFWSVAGRTDRKTIVPVLIGNPFHRGLRKWASQCYSACRVRAVRHDALVLEGMQRSDVVSAFLDADVFVMGSRAETSPLVMFESFASETLFISTNIGTVGNYGDIARVVSGSSEAAVVVRDFCRNPEQFSDRMKKGRELVATSLNWESLARRYEQLYRQILESGK